MNINQENAMLEIADILSTFNCDGLECQDCPLFCEDGNYHCLCLKMSNIKTDIMIRRGAWKRNKSGRLVIDL